MTIKKANLQFKSTTNRDLKVIKTVVLHHAAATSCTVEDIHKWHLQNGWSGFGYHFFVRKSGEIWEGRPLDKVGAHCKNNNTGSVGICFEGNFENENMQEAQIKAGGELLAYLNGKLAGLTIKLHKELNATDCPGKNFPLSSILLASQGKTEAKQEEAANTPTLKKGSKGAAVRTLQEQLNKNGAKLAVDGDFGAKTLEAVWTYQKAKGLVIDGIVGKNTWGKLLDK
ncbi:MAG: N-acetylmuramoyl-L-alanine amidase [Oscillospiraceae bacterium]|jgi:N-acetyl-anhydromuramyl-L-alanine amidase AmpD|nr:N-acetylmuramoyl-L-alanine amidase [Oscillospiraceae bacterium]